MNNEKYWFKTCNNSLQLKQEFEIMNSLKDETDFSMLPTDFTFQIDDNRKPFLITKDEGVALDILRDSAKITSRQCDMYMNKAQKELDKHDFKHDDVHPRNVILNEKTRKCTVIDFETLWSGDSTS